MFIVEQHILFDQILQQLNSNRKGTIQPEEKDILINYYTYEWLRSNLPVTQTSLGFEDNESKYDKVQELKRTIVKPLETVALSYTTDKTYVRSLVPMDYLHHVNSRSTLKYNCAGVTPSTTSGTNYYATVTFTNDVPPAPNTYFNTMTITINLRSNAVNYPITLFTASLIGKSLYSNAAKFEIINYAINYINNTKRFYHSGGTIWADVEACWERYNNSYYANKFVIRVIDNYQRTATVNPYIPYDATVNTRVGGGAIAATASFSTTSYAYTSLTTSTSSSLYEKRNRLISSERFDVLDDPFGKTKYESPIVILENNEFRVYYNSTFVPSNIILNYIKKPILVNYYAGVSSDLNDKACGEITALAARGAEAFTNSEMYQKLLLELQNVNK